MLLWRVCWRKSENFVRYECINMIVSTWLLSALHKVLATQCYLYLKAHPQGIVEIQSFVTDLTFFWLCRGIDGTKYEMSQWLSFPLWVQGHESVLWVQPICLSVCLSVWSVYFCLCTQMAGLAIWVHIFSFAVSKLGSWPSYFKCNLMCLLVYSCVHKVTRS
jgi:hypothetical protein